MRQLAVYLLLKLTKIDYFGKSVQKNIKIRKKGKVLLVNCTNVKKRNSQNEKDI